MSNNNTAAVLFNEALPIGDFNNATNATASRFDMFVDTVYYEINAARDSQMIMGTMFLGMILGMIVVVLCCVKHKADGYYRVPPQRHREEEIELVRTNVHKGKVLGEARFEIGTDDDN